VAGDGAQANGLSDHAAIAADGQTVAMASRASNLVPGDTNGFVDVFVHQRAPAAGPNAPSNLTASVAGFTVTLRWDPPATGSLPASYIVEAGSVSGASNLFNQDVGLTSSITAQAPTGVYFVRVRARNAAGVSAPSNEIVVRVGVGCSGPPGPPGQLSASIDGLSVTLTWGAAGGEPATYLVEAGSSPGTSELALLDVGAQTRLSASAPPGTYFVRVRARNACGSGPPGNEVQAVVAPPSPPSPPGSLAASVTGRRVTLTWTASTGGPSSYDLEVGSTSGGADLLRLNTGNPQTQLAGDAAPGTYFVRIRARNAIGVSAASNEVVVVVR
jgi:hypothetical protein